MFTPSKFPYLFVLYKKSLVYFVLNKNNLYAQLDVHGANQLLDPAGATLMLSVANVVPAPMREDAI
ncbi:hypothetical protein CMO85_05710 [Candidatus Woesearchaeota archaeon]|nr:hypothetical protein [Candidatus Woesearchaeota archaeon]